MIAEQKLKLSDYVISSPIISDSTSKKPFNIVFSTRSSEIIRIDNLTWQLLKKNDFKQIKSDTILELERKKIIVPEAIDELSLIIKENNEAIESLDDLYHAIQPTASCQMGCGYCGQSHTKRLLTEKQQDEIISLIRIKLERNQYKTLSIGWFGAEPLSGLPVIRNLSPRLIELAKEYNCKYNAKIVTNGLAYTKNVAAELCHKFYITSAEITIDGTAEFHNNRRFLKNKKPTFNKIVKNLIAVASSNEGINLVVRCNVDEENESNVSELIKFLASKKLENKISFYVAPIHSWGNDAHEKSLKSKEFAQKEIEWNALMMRLGFRIALIPPRKKIVCMALHKNAELIDAYGSIFNCSEVSYVDSYGKPNIYEIGTLAKDNLPKKNRPFSNFNQEIKSGFYDCSKCEMLPTCGGGCPKQWAEGNIPCPTPKHNMPERLVLMYASAKINGQLK